MKRSRGSICSGFSSKRCLFGLITFVSVVVLLLVAQLSRTDFSQYARKPASYLRSLKGNGKELQFPWWTATDKYNVETEKKNQSNPAAKEAGQKKETQRGELTNSAVSGPTKSASPESKTRTEPAKKLNQATETPKKEGTSKKKSTNSTLHPGAESASAEDKTSAQPKKKYMIYLCDFKTGCYGLGDRQRGIVSVYLLSEVLDRKFGILMTNPANLTDFYQQNIVDWIIPSSELKGKSSVIIQAYGPNDLHLPKTDFNKEYPQDVIYVRTNQKWQYMIPYNPLYKDKIPEWAQVPPTEVFQSGWVRLMTPAHELRQYLNEVLTDIAQSIHNEYRLRQTLESNGCCKSAKLPTKCTRILQKQRKSASTSKDLRSVFAKLCNASLSNLEPKVSVDDISKLKGFDKVDLNLVCVHVRMGHSSTLPFENNVRNMATSLDALWKFLKPYESKGHHIYLAADDDNVRLQAKTLLGDRLHISSTPIVHIARVQKGQDERMGLKFALMEQLLLSTSCKVLVVSYSGFSMKAAQIRDQLPGEKGEVYLFKSGKVVPKSANRFS